MAIPTKKEIMDFSPMNLGEKEILPEYKRKMFGEIERALSTGLIVALTGLRRVGKTTLMKQASSSGAFYFSFDEKQYTNQETLKIVIETFLSETEKPTILLDEIFRVDDWAGIIKRYHDQKRAKFIVSGSSALLIKKGVESLSGRLSELYIPPLQFDEYLEMKGKIPEKISLDRIFNAKKRYQTELAQFLINGSFPEIINSDEKNSHEYIRKSTIERIIFEDIPSAFKIEHPSKLYDLMKLSATNSSRLFTETSFAEALQISRHAVSDYLLYLKKAYLIDIIYPNGSFNKALKKQKKIFAKSASIYNALAENPSVGYSAETAVYDKLSQDKLTFYIDNQKREVDFITDFPLEVKYQSTITSEDSRSLMYCMEKQNKKLGIMVTKELFDERRINGKTILFIPMDVFLQIRKFDWRFQS